MKRKIEIESTSQQIIENMNGVGNSENVNRWTKKPYSSRYYEILAKRKQLPVYEFKNELELKVLQNQIVIIEGETGSGKTTQIPQVMMKFKI